MLGTPATLSQLAAIADEERIGERLQAMADGEIVNATERRAALHTALRQSTDTVITVDGDDVIPEVAAVQDRVTAFVEAVASGERRGGTGETIRSVVVIGIGGSDLGPRMVAAATRTFHTGRFDVHFVANVDPAELDAVLAPLDPRSTLVVVISKTFTTVETLANARAARQWLVAAVGEDNIGHHVCAVTTATDLAAEFGVSPDAVFGFWDWVGGRYSLSSPVGIGIEFAVGSEGMRNLRAGMHEVDKVVLSTPAPANAAVLLGMLDIWYGNYFGVATKAVIPYSQDLALLPTHLQQLQMESNGKSVTAEGEPVEWSTSPIVWGAPGTNGQHAFFQLLHQGTQLVPIDLIGVRAIHGNDRSDLLQANLLAQAAALALGRDADELRAQGVPEELVPHKTMPGNRPTTLIWLPDLSPRDVGALIALYEHATVVAGMVWQIDPFDQWGVERGKELAHELLPLVAQSGAEPAGAAVDASTAASLRFLHTGEVPGR